MPVAENQIAIARIYLTEGDHKLKALMARLHDEEQVRGVTVFRGISGFGRSGKLHSSDLLDLSGDLPVVIEFFDDVDKVTRIIDHIKQELEPGHIVYWQASVVN
jgi:PII-like signaling protein